MAISAAYSLCFFNTQSFTGPERVRRVRDTRCYVAVESEDRKDSEGRHCCEEECRRTEQPDGCRGVDTVLRAALRIGGRIAQKRVGCEGEGDRLARCEYALRSSSGRRRLTKSFAARVKSAMFLRSPWPSPCASSLPIITLLVTLDLYTLQAIAWSAH